MIFQISLFLIAIVVLLLYLDFKIQFRFWKNKNVPYLRPVFPMGNITDILKPKVHFGYLIQSIYNQMKFEGDYCGIFFSRNPVLLVLSPEFAKTVLVRDFNHFMDRGVFSNEKIDPLGANMFFLEGQRWKNLRAKLTPTFTSGKLKQIFHTVFDVGNKFIQYLEPLAATSQDIEVYDLFARYTTDAISSSAFGFDANSLEDPNTEFVKMGKKVLHFNKMKSLKIFFAMGFREQAKKMGIRFNDKDVEDFFIKIVRDTIDHRKKTGYARDDFMQILIDLMRNDESEVDKLTFNEIAAQAFAFYFAGKRMILRKTHLTSI
jgi:cytochrome P450 family 6